MKDPKRFRIEFLFSPGAAHNPLDVRIQVSCPHLKLYVQVVFSLQIPGNGDHMLPVIPPQSLRDQNPYLTFEEMKELLDPFAMPAEDFPPPNIAQTFPTIFTRGGSMFEKIANLWPFKLGYTSDSGSNGSGKGKKEKMKDF